MALTLVTAPVLEPVTLAEAKEHLRIDSSGFASAMTVIQTIYPGSHAITAALTGGTVTVLNYSALVVLEAGTCGTGGTVVVHLEDSADASIWADWSTAFTTVETVNDNAVYEKEYTGLRQYLRAIAVITGTACSFGVTILKSTPQTIEDTLITGFIEAARDYCEKYQNRAYIDQTWNLVLDDWPNGDILEIPRPPLGTVTSIIYYATGGTAATMTASTYIVDTDSEPGRVSLGYGEIWPSTTLRPIKGVIIQYLAGYGSAASSVPTRIKQAIKMLVGHMYEHRENTEIKELIDVPYGVHSLLTLDRIWPI